MTKEVCPSCGVWKHTDLFPYLSGCSDYEHICFKCLMEQVDRRGEAYCCVCRRTLTPEEVENAIKDQNETRY